MALKNAQYNAVMRQYDARQLDNQFQHRMRLAKVYETIPGFKEIDQHIASLSADCARAALSPGNRQESLAQLRENVEKCTLQKAQLLVDYGFGRDYLSPVYHCQDCKDTGYIGSEKCHCFKQAVVDLLYAQSNIHHILAAENFSTFDDTYYSTTIDKRLGISPRENIQEVLSVCQQFVEDFDTQPGNLLFYGSTGVGKTFLSNCIAKALLDRSHTVIYLTAFQLVEILEHNTFGSTDPEDCNEGMFDYIFDCDLLIIDDLGTELNNSFVTSQLFLCLNQRLLRRKATIISTNLSLEELQAAYSERIFSRIVSAYQVLLILGEDIRIRKKLLSDH